MPSENKKTRIAKRSKHRSSISAIDGVVIVNAIERARNSVAAQLCASGGPMRFNALMRVMHYEADFLKRVISCDRFIETADGYTLPPQVTNGVSSRKHNRTYRPAP